jgi:hypothetical protein
MLAVIHADLVAVGPVVLVDDRSGGVDHAHYGEPLFVETAIGDPNYEDM